MPDEHICPTCGGSGEGVTYDSGGAASGWDCPDCGGSGKAENSITANENTKLWYESAASALGSFVAHNNDNAELVRALTKLERAATILSNHDRISQPPRGRSQWDKLHSAIDIARDALARHKSDKEAH